MLDGKLIGHMNVLISYLRQGGGSLLFCNRKNKRKWRFISKATRHTRQEVITKLDALTVNVSYPQKLDPLCKKFKVDENASLLTNAQNFTEIVLADHYSRWDKTVDRTRWQMAAHTVNALIIVHNLI